MEEASSRRGFLRALLRESARTVQEASDVLGPAKPRRPAPPPLARRGPELQRARVAAGTVPLDELLELAAEHGLDDRLDEVRALARHAVRLTSPTLQHPPAGAWLFEPAPGLVEEAERPLWNGERLTLVAQLDLEDPALRDHELSLPPHGRLAFLYAALQAPDGGQEAHAGAGRVLHVHDTGLAAEARLSVELTLPRVWSQPVQRLELDPMEHDGWLRLRRRLAVLQDVELDDGFGAPVAFHHVLGYPTDADAPLPPGEEDWRLLAQFTADEAGPWNLGGESGRLLFWIRDADLRAGDLSRVWATARAVWE